MMQNKAKPAFSNRSPAGAAIVAAVLLLQLGSRQSSPGDPLVITKQPSQAAPWRNVASH
jgi:hypothetical protein